MLTASCAGGNDRLLDLRVNLVVTGTYTYGKHGVRENKSVESGAKKSPRRKIGGRPDAKKEYRSTPYGIKK